MRKITAQLVKRFERHLINEEKAEATLEKYLRDIRAFDIWISGRALNKNLVLAYKQYLIENYAPASVNSMLSSINSFFHYVEWYELKVKALKIQKQIFIKKDTELTKDEYIRLLRAAKQKRNRQLYLLMQTICATGIRVSELKSITVETVKNREAKINCKGKIRIVILPNRLCQMLQEFIKKEKITKGAVFVTRNGKPLDRSNIWRLMKSLCEFAGISRDKVFPHALRHLFARTYYALEKDIVRLADILGHSSMNTTRIYTMETGEIHRKQIQKLGLMLC